MVNIFLIVLSATVSLAYKELLADFTFIRCNKFILRKDNDPVEFAKIAYLVQKRIIFKYRYCRLPYLAPIKYALINSLGLPSLNDQLFHFIKLLKYHSEGVIDDLPSEIPIVNNDTIPEEIRIFIPKELLDDFSSSSGIQSTLNFDSKLKIDAIFKGDRLKVNLLKEAIIAFCSFSQSRRFLPPLVKLQLSRKNYHSNTSPDLVVLDWINWHLKAFLQVRDSLFNFNFGTSKGTFLFFFYYLSYIQKLSCLCESLSYTLLTTINVELVGFLCDYLNFAKKFPSYKKEIGRRKFTGWLLVNKNSQHILLPYKSISNWLTGGIQHSFTQISLYFIKIETDVFKKLKNWGLNSHEHHIMRYSFIKGNEIAIFTTNPDHGEDEFENILKAISSGSYEFY